MFLRLFLWGMVFILFSTSASAYIDPGTAGTVVGGSIWSFIVLIFTAIGLFFSRKLITPIKNYFKKLKK